MKGMNGVRRTIRGKKQKVSGKDPWENAGRMRDLCLKVEALRVSLSLSSWDQLGKAVARDRALSEARGRGEELGDAQLEEEVQRRRTMLHPIKRGARPAPDTLQALARLAGDPIDVWHEAAHWVPPIVGGDAPTTYVKQAVARYQHMLELDKPNEDEVSMGLRLTQAIFEEGRAKREVDGRADEPPMLAPR